MTSDAIDYDDGQIVAAQKGRGLADCISHAAWTWNGTNFIATSEVAPGLCRGVPGGTGNCRCWSARSADATEKGDGGD
ncbi:DUF1176 domain-containing protein [Stenotrophomonas sp. CD2]|nr:DUF1176 domain-containing protein [Stenotrophomonas sp. CD2]